MNLIIKSYKRENSKIELKIELLNKGDVWKSKLFHASPGEIDVYPLAVLKGDSVIVNFNDDKKIVFLFTFEEPDSIAQLNILNDDNYERTRNNDDYLIKRYTFTNEDYNNAQVIDGG